MAPGALPFTSRMPLPGKCPTWSPADLSRGRTFGERRFDFEGMIDFQQLGAGWTTGGALALLVFQLLGPVFWWWQNSRPDRVGGAISLVKAQWFVFVVSLWVVAPLLASGHAEARMICLILAGSSELREDGDAAALYYRLADVRLQCACTWCISYSRSLCFSHRAAQTGLGCVKARLGIPR